jgi:hypothetical protein
MHYVPYTRGALMGWRNFSKTAENKFLQPTRSGCTRRNRLGYPAHTGLISLSVCLFVCPLSMKTRWIFTWKLKLGCPRGVFGPLSIPSEYLFLCMRRKFGFNQKIRRKSLIVYVYYQPNSCTMCHTPAEHWWAWETFLRQRKTSSSSLRAAGVCTYNIPVDS